VQPFHDHATCLALASVLKGQLCDSVFTAEAASIPKGARIYQPGDRDAVLHRVISGLVGLSSIAPNGDEVTLHLYGPRDVFGELCFCGSVQMHFATALEPTEIVSAHADRIVAALRDRPDLALDLIKVLSERLASAYAELQAVSADPLITRLARRLFELCASSDDDGWFRLPRRFTHDELARLLGVRRESLTRAMIDLRALGLIDYGQNAPIRVALSPVRRFIATTRATDLLPRQHPT
jgi:CRP-like cAMP-binding protein